MVDANFDFLDQDSPKDLYENNVFIDKLIEETREINRQAEKTAIGACAEAFNDFTVPEAYHLTILRRESSDDFTKIQNEGLDDDCYN